MKLTYELIEHNLKTFEEAKIKFPILQKFINGEIPNESLKLFGLTDFGRFNKFLNENKLIGLDPIMKRMTWRKLKPILIGGAHLDRFKVYLKNRTEKKFIDTLKSGITYDKLLNGKWARKESRRRGGIRSEIKISSFKSHSSAIINFIIHNEIEISHNETFGTEWYFTTRLNLDNTFTREMAFTEEFLKPFIKSIEKSKIDFKKLNVDYITNFISDRLRQLMSVNPGTKLKCIKSKIFGSNTTISEGQIYDVTSSTIRDGNLRVYVTNNQGRSEDYLFSYFEDISFNRNSILDELLC